MAMQGDVAVQVQAAKRGLVSKTPTISIPTRWAALGTIGLFATILAPVIVTGAPLPMLPSPLLPILDTDISAAVGLFLGTTVIWLLLVFFVTSAAIAFSRHKGTI